MKKVLCLLLAILMVGGMFTACGSENHKADGGSDFVTTETDNVTNDENAPVVENDTTAVALKACEPELVVNLTLNGNDVIYDENGIKITLTKVEKSAWMVYFYFEVVNNSDKIIQLCGNYAKANNQSTALYQSELIPAGETRQEQMSFDATYFEAEPMEYLELAFSIMECASEDYQDYAGPLVEDVLAVYQAEGYDGKKYSPATSGEVVYEDAYIAIYVNKSYIVDKGQDKFQYTMINKTDVPVYVTIPSCEYELNRYANESTASCIGAEKILAPNSYCNGLFRIYNWRDDVEGKDLVSANFVLEGYLIDCSDEMEDVKFFDMMNNKADVRQTLPFHEKTFTINFS